ncbi:MAG TPA: DNA repair protein RadA [Geminicoccaceae bacterium]|nr:DNA repair protein RadA [Geminicoccaceae bacterium]
MPRPQKTYVCQSCGAVHPKWSGRCEGCGAWNTLVEEIAARPPPKGLKPGLGSRLELHALEGAEAPPPRVRTGIEELDRVVGGGLVPGSALLIGGDPGIGKSTLTLQAAAALARQGLETVYVSGEEAIDQIRLRAGRLGLAKAPVMLAAATSVRDILDTVDRQPPPELLVIDSIQTMYVDELEQGAGSVTQLRASTDALIRFAKRRGTALWLIGHVTKEGMIAGPRVLEHMVDAVVYFEGERGHPFRILRAVKNRFGPANEIGVFEMQEEGLVPVPNPSALFLSEHEEGVAGSAVFAGIEGSRPVLVEIQALVAPAPPGSARRAVVGWDGGRLAMVLAVLEARCGLVMSGRDVYLNVAGGLRVQEPAADLAVSAALVSSLVGVAVPASTVVFGEVGLGGEVRAVGHGEARLKEAAKLGFARAIVPRAKRPMEHGLQVAELGRLADLVELFAPGSAALSPG